MSVKADERTVAVRGAANTWGINVLLFGLMVDIACRWQFFQDPAWDLVGLIGASGIVVMGYLARHNVLRQVSNWKVAFIWPLLAALVPAIAAILHLAIVR